MNQKIKVAQIGVGNWGKKLLQEFVKQAEVVAACHAGKKETSEFLAGLSIPAQDFNDILANEEINAIIIATPIETHYELAKQALEAGKHVFVEKPGSSTLDEINVLCKLADKKGLKLAVGYEFVHHAALKKISEVRSLRKIESIEMQWLKFGTFGNSIVLNLLCHEISILLALGLEIHPFLTEVQEDFVELADRLNKIHILINRRVADKKIKSVEITFEGEVSPLLWIGDSLYQGDSTKEKLPVEIEPGSAVAREIIDFLNSIQSGKKPLTDGEFARTVLAKLTPYL